MPSNKEQYIKTTIKVLFALLLVSIGLLIGAAVYLRHAAPTVIPNNTITTGDAGKTASISARRVNILTASENEKRWTSSNPTILKLFKGQGYDETSFAVSNMFPGDAIRKDYLVQLSHKGKITVNFSVHVHPTTDKENERLEEVLMCTVEVDGQRLYNGLMRDIPALLEYATAEVTRPTTTEIPYTVTAYLDGPSVGNAHMNKGLSADFQWWVTGYPKAGANGYISPYDDDGYGSSDDDDDSSGGSSGGGFGDPSGDVSVKGEWEESGEENYDLLVLPMTGDDTDWVIYAAACAGSLLMLLLLAKRRKEESHD